MDFKIGSIHAIKKPVKGTIPGQVVRVVYNYSDSLCIVKKLNGVVLEIPHSHLWSVENSVKVRTVKWFCSVSDPDEAVGVFDRVVGQDLKDVPLLSPFKGETSEVMAILFSRLYQAMIYPYEELSR